MRMLLICFLFDFQALSDIEVAMTILKKNVKNENPVDTHYDMLDCTLEPMDKKGAEFKV